MKKIVRGNDFTLRVPVRKIVNGEKERFPLPACEEIEVNLVNAFRRRRMALQPAYRVYLRKHPYVPAWELNFFCR